VRGVPGRPGAPTRLSCNFLFGSICCTIALPFAVNVCDAVRVDLGLHFRLHDVQIRRLGLWDTKHDARQPFAEATGHGAASVREYGDVQIGIWIIGELTDETLDAAAMI
jgi:hypothetical protein